MSSSAFSYWESSRQALAGKPRYAVMTHRTKIESVETWGKRTEMSEDNIYCFAWYLLSFGIWACLRFPSGNKRQSRLGTTKKGYLNFRYCGLWNVWSRVASLVVPFCLNKNLFLFVPIVCENVHIVVWLLFLSVSCRTQRCQWCEVLLK